MLNDGSLMEQRMQDSLNSIPDNEINLRELFINPEERSAACYGLLNTNSYE